MISLALGPSETGIVVVAIISAVAGLITTAVSIRSNREGKKVDRATALTDQLATRLDKVEAKMTDTEEKLTGVQDELREHKDLLQTAVGFINRLVVWGRNGGKEKMPTPPSSLHKYLDGDEWPNP